MQTRISGKTKWFTATGHYKGPWCVLNTVTGKRFDGGHYIAGQSIYWLTTECKLNCGKLLTLAYVHSQRTSSCSWVTITWRQHGRKAPRLTDAHSRHFPGQTWKLRRILDRVVFVGATTWTRDYWPRSRNASFAKYLKLLEWNDPISQQRPRQGLVVSSNRFTASPLHYEYSNSNPFLSIYSKSQINERDSLTQVTALFCQIIRFVVFCISTHVSLPVFWISRTNFRAYTRDGQNNGNSCERFTFVS
jgi:hypothetical protein